MWERIKRFFKRSETILWARLQVLLGLIAAAVVSVDPSLIAPFLEPKWVPVAFAVNGVVTEVLRRSRTHDRADGGLQ